MYQQLTNISDSYYHSQKHVVLYLRVLGVLPIQRTKEAKHFRCSAMLVLYSVLIYFVALSSICYTFLRDSKIKNFNVFIVFTSPLAFFSIVLLIPLTFWIDARKVAEYFNTWSTFQAHYYRICGTPLIFSTRKKSLAMLSSSVLLMAAIEVLYQNTFSTNLNPCDICIHYYVNIMKSGTGVFWYTLCDSLVIAGRQLLKEITKKVDKCESSTLFIPDYTVLWMELSHIVKTTGHMFYHTIGFLIVYLSIKISINSCMICSNLFLIKQSVTRYDLYLLFIIVIDVMTLFIICDQCDGVYRTVVIKFKEELLTASIKSRIDKNTKKELKFLLQTIKIYSPEICLGGFLSLNRQTAVSIASLLTTYLIVMLQLNV